MMVLDDHSGNYRMVVRANSGRYYWMTRKGVFSLIPPRRLGDLRQAMIQAAWVRRQKPYEEDLRFTVVDELTCDPLELYRVGSRTYTRCDLILHFPKISYDPTKWTTTDPERMLERIRKRQMLRFVRTMEAGRIRQKRGDYTFVDDADAARITLHHRLPIERKAEA